VRVGGDVLRVPSANVPRIMAEEAALSELLLRTFLVRHARLMQRGAGPTLVGSRFDSRTRALLEVMARNRVSFRWLDLESASEAEDMLKHLDVPLGDLPLIVIPGGSLLRNPSGHELLSAWASPPPTTTSPPRCATCSWSAAARRGSRPRSTGVGGDDHHPRRGHRSRGAGGDLVAHRELPGVPRRPLGDELTARGSLQARKFGVRIKLGEQAVGLSSVGDSHQVRFESGEVITARSVIIATGAATTACHSSGSTSSKASASTTPPPRWRPRRAPGAVVVVGGGNSAGQAALFLAQACTSVRIVIRGASLTHSMSRYLIDQIDRQPLISVVTRSEVVGLLGDKVLTGVEVADNRSGSLSTEQVCGLFVFIGAKPSTSGSRSSWPPTRTASSSPARTSRRPHPSQPGMHRCCSRPAGGRLLRGRRAEPVDQAGGDGHRGGSMAVRLVFDRLQATGLAVADARP